MSDIQEKIKAETEAAREACATDGSNSDSCASAWDVVEELQAEASHQREVQPKKSSFDQYCDDNPEADECRVYDN